MAIGDDIELGEVAVIGVVIVIIGYALYKVYGSIGAGLSAIWDSLTGALKSNPVLPQSGGVPNDPNNSSQLDPNYVIPNTGGVTVGALQQGGLSDGEINDLNQQFNPGATQGVTGVPDKVMIAP